MLITEYDYDMDIAVQREEAAEEAEERGRELGRAEGMELGEKRGMELGEKRGMELGEKRGMELGEKRGILLTKEALKLHAQGKDAEEIAGILKLPVEQVQLMLS